MPKQRYDTAPHIIDVGPLGVVEGITLSQSGKEKLHYFGGLPYALPPVGPFRFRKPRPLAPCYRYGHTSQPGRFVSGCGVCPQPGWRKAADSATWDESCLDLNIYVPAGTAPKEGWPVYFYIHGGFLQFGSANEKPEAFAPLLSETDFKCIVVMPAYRLNLFGFLASKELRDEAARNHESAGNYGFQDQRLALEWIWKNITLFGGNHSRITVGGYSAGAHSAFQQLAHELYFVPDNKAVIKGIVMWSNGPGVQPRSIDEQQQQFDELLTVLGIPLDLEPGDKLTRLRETPDSKLIAAQGKMKLTEFRASTDDEFISSRTIANINSGDFARRMQRRGIRLMSGENSDEHHVYRQWRTCGNTYQAMKTRLTADFPPAAVTKLLTHYAVTPHRLPAGSKDWQDLFGRVYADVQVHGLQRGFHNNLFGGGLVPGKDVFRYRFDKRMSCADAFFPPEWKVTHGTDLAIWLWGADWPDGLTDEEKGQVQGWTSCLAAFVRGDPVEWGTSKPTDVRMLRSDGTTDVWRDELWEEGVRMWEAINGPGHISAKAHM